MTERLLGMHSMRRSSLSLFGPWLILRLGLPILVLVVVALSACTTDSEVRIQRGRILWDPSQDLVEATFVPAPPDGEQACRDDLPGGPCSLRTCVKVPIPDNMPNAGTIEIDGARHPVVLKPRIDLPQYYGVDSGEVDVLEKGAKVTASASGGGIPAFVIPAVEAPAPISVAYEDYVWSITPGENVRLVWSGGDDEVVFSRSVETPEVTSELTCTFDGRAGRGIVPGSVLWAMPSCSSPGSYVGNSCSFTLAARVTSHVQVGVADIELRVYNGGISGGW